MKDLMKSKKMWIAFVLIFLSGIAIGVIGGIFYQSYFFSTVKKEDQRHQERVKMHMLRRMSSELELTEEQKGQVEQILGEMTKSINDIHVDQRPKIKSIIDKSFAKIDKILTDEQKAKMLKMQERMAKFREKHRQEWDRRKRGGRRGEGPPPPPEWQNENGQKRFRPEGQRMNFDGDPRKRRDEWKKKQVEIDDKLPPPPPEP